MLTDLLGSLGVAAEEAENGRVALDRLTDNEWDAVLLDLAMPEVDGFRVLSSLQRKRSGTLGRVIVISGFASHESRARELGANRFIRKPIDFSRLMKELSELGIDFSQ
jgi:CheY-like chemotaxis protein